MVAKRPTGERPKKNSSLAQFIAGIKSDNLTPAEARVAAGRYRDMVDKIPAKNRTLDNTGVVLGKAITATQKNPKQKNPKPDKKASLIQDITNRYRVTAREARDIVTAAATLGTSVKKDVSSGYGNFFTTHAAKNLGTQIKETAKAATTGKTGTSARVIKQTNVGDKLYEGKKR